MIHSLSHLPDQILVRDLATLVGQDRSTTADLLTYLAEFDARRLYVPAGYSSMYAYCVDELHLSEDAAYKRIQAARAARQFPALFTAVAQGRLHLAAVCLLAPHLNQRNVDELIAVAAHQRKSEIERRLAARFPRTELMGLVQALPANSGRPNGPVASGQVGGVDAGASSSAVAFAAGQGRVEAKAPFGPAGEQPASSPFGESACIAGRPVDATGGNELAADLAAQPTSQLAPGQVGAANVATLPPLGSQPAPGPVEEDSASPPSRVAPSAPERYRVEVTIGKGTHDNLRYAQALLSHSIPSGDLAQVLDRALSALIRELEKRKLGTGGKPRRRPRSSASGRYVSKRVRRAVWERDQGQCTFVSDVGHRCGERRFLEFDHIDPVARGGRATVDRLRLRCRAHNQYEAERAFGTEFMHQKRRGASRKNAGTRKRDGARERAP